MIVQYSPDFLQRVKKLNVRIYNSLRKQLEVFSRNPNDPILQNHDLRGEWKGYKSININSDWRVLYQEIREGGEVIAYFSFIGTHKDLYNW